MKGQTHSIRFPWLLVIVLQIWSFSSYTLFIFWCDFLFSSDLYLGGPDLFSKYILCSITWVLHKDDSELCPSAVVTQGSR